MVEDSVRRRCLFCGTTSGKRSREHVFRRAFKGSHREASSLTFSAQTREGLEVYTRPISQFDMTLNRVCQECNSGWLNDLENAVTPILEAVAPLPNGTRIDSEELRVLGFWAYVRALIRTRVSPLGHAPDALFELAYQTRTVPRGCFVQSAWCTHYLFEAGAHQACRLGGNYLAYMTFGLSSLLFFVSITDDAGRGSRALDVSRRPRLWFPGALHWLTPTEQIDVGWSPRVLIAEEAVVAGLSLAIRLGVEPLVNYLGDEVDPTLVIPPRFHANLAWPDVESDD